MSVLWRLLIFIICVRWKVDFHLWSLPRQTSYNQRFSNCNMYQKYLMGFVWFCFVRTDCWPSRESNCLSQSERANPTMCPRNESPGATDTCPWDGPLRLVGSPSPGKNRYRLNLKMRKQTTQASHPFPPHKYITNYSCLQHKCSDHSWFLSTITHWHRKLEFWQTANHPDSSKAVWPFHDTDTQCTALSIND